MSETITQTPLEQEIPAAGLPQEDLLNQLLKPEVQESLILLVEATAADYPTGECINQIGRFRTVGCNG